MRWIILLVTTLFLAVVPVAADEFYKAKVTKIFNESVVSDSNAQQYRYHTVEVDLAGQTISVPNTQTQTSSGKPIINVGDQVVLVKVDTEYQIIDQYRLDKVIAIVLGFFVLVVCLGRWKGVGSIVGMVISLVTIVKFIVPQILAGHDPLLISIAGSIFIMTLTIYLAHGFSPKTTLAVISTFICLALVGIFAVAFVNLTHLVGLGSEETYALQFGPTRNINLQGLLLGGIIIGALGVLDDITTSLSAAIFEIHQANPKQKIKALLKSGWEVGTEHIASLVNTLVLAYAGASLPIFLYLVLNVNDYPLWMVLNGEPIMEEVIRTIAGSLGLLAAVPITTFLAAWYVTTIKSVKTG